MVSMILKLLLLKDANKLCLLSMFVSPQPTGQTYFGVKGCNRNSASVTVHTVVYLMHFHTKQHTIEKCFHHLIKVRIKCSFQTTKSLLI